ncbi:DUF350 domain-containing protein [Sutcliffiella deserti]|uniref:DUF350 domain-containing protein n=1 Tax=Sutcliffiella deserti TaxID=2875501 RepID=UPI001CBE3B5A|nr:DUF350 domain-containing protein [Sutcliffiella deserti]
MEAILLTLMYFVLAVAIVIVGLVIFEMMTRKYKDWDEIQSGNQAVALSITGKVIGICIVLAFSIYHSSQLLDTLLWGGIGVVLQVIAYILFELFTRKFSVEEELKKGNVSVAIISVGVSIGLALVIGASIT